MVAGFFGIIGVFVVAALLTERFTLMVVLPIAALVGLALFAGSH